MNIIVLKVFDLMPSSSKRRSNAMVVDDVGVDALIDTLLQPPETTNEPVSYLHIILLFFLVHSVNSMMNLVSSFSFSLWKWIK